MAGTSTSHSEYKSQLILTVLSDTSMCLCFDLEFLALLLHTLAVPVFVQCVPTILTHSFTWTCLCVYESHEWHQYFISVLSRTPFNIFLLHLASNSTAHQYYILNDERLAGLSINQTREKQKWWREKKRKHDTNPMVLATRVVKMRWSVIPAQTHKTHTAFEWTSIHS